MDQIRPIKRLSIFDISMFNSVPTLIIRPCHAAAPTIIRTSVAHSFFRWFPRFLYAMVVLAPQLGLKNILLHFIFLSLNILSFI